MIRRRVVPWSAFGVTSCATSCLSSGPPNIATESDRTFAVITSNLITYIIITLDPRDVNTDGGAQSGRPRGDRIVSRLSFVARLARENAGERGRRGAEDVYRDIVRRCVIYESGIGLSAS